MHVALEEPELVDELPADYPDRRPRRYGACLRLGLGERVPCVFVTCRHNLLSDEIAGPLWDGETSIKGLATCALRVAAEGRHSSVTISKLTVFCESTVEEWARRSSAKLLLGLGIDEFIRLGKYKKPRVHEHLRASPSLGNLAVLVEAAWKRGMPALNVPPARRLKRAEAEAAYPGKVHPDYGQPKGPGAVSRALGGAAAAPDEQEAETPKETAPPVAGDSNRQDGDGRG
jgi:hypothetical protein